MAEEAPLVTTKLKISTAASLPQLKLVIADSMTASPVLKEEVESSHWALYNHLWNWKKNISDNDNCETNKEPSLVGKKAGLINNTYRLKVLEVSQMSSEGVDAKVETSLTTISVENNDPWKPNNVFQLAAKLLVSETFKVKKEI